MAVRAWLGSRSEWSVMGDFNARNSPSLVAGLAALTVRSHSRKHRHYGVGCAGFVAFDARHLELLREMPRIRGAGEEWFRPQKRGWSVMGASIPGNSPSLVAGLVAGSAMTSTLRGLLVALGSDLQIAELEGSAAVRQAVLDDPGVVLVSFTEHADECTNLIRTVSELDSSCPILFLYTPGLAVEALRIGEHQSVLFLEWPATHDALRAAMQELHHLRLHILQTQEDLDSCDDRLSQVSKREAEVLELVCAGEQSDSIAQKLHISRRTVDDHRRAILKKTGSSSPYHVISLYHRAERLRHELSMLTAHRWRNPNARPAEPEGLLGAPPLDSALRPSQAPPEWEAFGDALVRLEHDEQPAYVLDHHFDIVWTNSAWRMRDDSSAQHSGVGSNLITSLPPILRSWFVERLRKCLESSASWFHEYSCPTETHVNRMLLSVSSGPDSCLLCRHALLSSSRHEPDAVVDASHFGGRNGKVEQCAICLRCWSATRREWVLVRCWLTRLPTMRSEVICPECERTHPGC